MAQDKEKIPQEKDKALENAIAQIEKQFGRGSIMKLGQAATMKVEAIPTGSLTLDIALGIGGVPRGRIVEIYGSQKMFSKEINLSEQSITAKLNGRSDFSKDDILKWSDALRLSSEEIGAYFFTT